MRQKRRCRSGLGKGKYSVDFIRLGGYVWFMKTLAQLFKALSDETRLRILALLTEGELCVCELMATLDLPQSTVSRHLAYLKNSGLVEDRRQGIWMYYRLREGKDPFRQELMTLLESLLREQPQAKEDLERMRSSDC